jgi:hypothetical protein
MKKAHKKEDLDDDLRPEYDLSKLKGGVRGKYARRFKSQTSLIALSPDLVPYFPDERAVNKALRALVTIAKVHPPHRG